MTFGSLIVLLAFVSVLPSALVVRLESFGAGSHVVICVLCLRQMMHWIQEILQAANFSASATRVLCNFCGSAAQFSEELG